MKFLVTGGAGFIGSHVCERLAREGHEVVALDDLSSGKRENISQIQGVTLRVGSIIQPGVFDDIGEYDGIVHLAAIASVERCRVDWFGTHQVNLGGTVHLFAAIAKSGKAIPVVYASSAATYGDNPNIPLKENELAAPLSAYGQDKLSCEHAAAMAKAMYDTGSLGFRFFNVYGPRQDPASPYSGVVSIFQDRIGRKVPVTIFGDGGQTRDFIYVGDVVEALVRGLNHLKTYPGTQEVLNVCTGVQTSVRTLADTLGQLYHHHPEIAHQPAREGDIRLSCGDASKLYQILGHIQHTPLLEGLGYLVNMHD